MIQLKVEFNRNSARLFKARLREKKTMKSQIIFCVGTDTWSIENQLTGKFGKTHYVCEIARLTPEQVIRAAQKHLPKIFNA